MATSLQRAAHLVDEHGSRAHAHVACVQETEVLLHRLGPVSDRVEVPRTEVPEPRQLERIPTITLLPTRTDRLQTPRVGHEDLVTELREQSIQPARVRADLEHHSTAF